MTKFSIHHATNFTNMSYGRNEMLKSVKITDELGYQMNSIMCHMNWMPNSAEVVSSWIMAAEFAMNTKNTDVGIIVTDVFRTHPSQIALNSVHLQRLLKNDNHFVLGLGAGEGANVLNYGINFEKPVSHLEEAVQVIKLLFESHPKNKVNFEGNYFNLKKINLQFQNPIPPKIWLAAGRERTLTITANHADGWVPVGSTPKLYKKQAKIVDSKGRQVEKGYNCFISMSKKDPEKAKKVADLVASVTCCRPEILEEHGINIEIPEKMDFIKHFALPMKKQKTYTANAMGFAQKNIPEEVRLQTVLSGSPDDVIQQIEKWIEAGCEHFCLQFMGDDYFGSLKEFSEDVMPHFK